MEEDSLLFLSANSIGELRRGVDLSATAGVPKPRTWRPGWRSCCRTMAIGCWRAIARGPADGTAAKAAPRACPRSIDRRDRAAARPDCGDRQHSRFHLNRDVRADSVSTAGGARDSPGPAPGPILAWPTLSLSNRELSSSGGEHHATSADGYAIVPPFMASTLVINDRDSCLKHLTISNAYFKWLNRTCTGVVFA